MVAELLYTHDMTHAHNLQMRMVCTLEHVVVSTDPRSAIRAPFVFIHLSELAVVQILLLTQKVPDCAHTTAMLLC